MSLYHLSCKIIGRSGGKSSVGASAYRAGEKITNETDGMTHDFSRRKNVLHKEILAPQDCPEWATDRAKLWNETEKKENRKNSQFARDFDIALQKEFSINENIDLIKKWVTKNYINRCGAVADIAIHDEHKEGNSNIHAHIMITTRAVNADGWGDKDRDGNDRDFLNNVRADWANLCNDLFEKKGYSQRIDHRTLEQQGIDREPQQHQGAIATAMERKGKNPDRQKQKTALIKPIFDDINITDEEVKKALENDLQYNEFLDEYKTAKIFVDFEKMTPEKWSDFYNNKYDDYAKQQEQKALLDVTFSAKNEIINVFKNEKKKTLDTLSKHVENAPHIDEKKAIGFIAKYTTDDGEVFKDYDLYKNAQQRNINLWNIQKTKYDNDIKLCEKIVDGANKITAKDDRKAIFDVAKNIKIARPKMYAVLKKTAENLLKKAKEFKMYRDVVNAVETLKTQKNKEVYNANTNNRKKLNNNRDNGWSR